MDALRYLLSSVGMVTYTAINYGIGILPNKSQARAHVVLDMLEATVGIFLGPLLVQLNPPRVDLTGKVAVVTGANSGIGQSIATDLACSGATVYLACRNESKAQAARDQITSRDDKTAKLVHILKLDTSDLNSVRSAAEAFKKQRTKLDILVHNAGIATPSDNANFSPQGFEIVYASNLLGSFLFTYLLEGVLSPQARIILTTSNAQYNSGFSRDFATASITDRREDGFHCPKLGPNGGINQALYANTKAMQCAFAASLQRRFHEHAQGGMGKVVHSFEPGFTKSSMVGKMQNVENDFVFRTLIATQNMLATETSQGAATGLWLASTDDQAVVKPGRAAGYWSRMSRRTCKADLMDEEMLRRFWTRWENDAGIEWR